ncbi:hypothetical protein [Amycolatopsis sp. lyj-23]|uniref:hypothetical protein n=1 Tax=Amycolatopsis sp. lyj-23 TaxID=2789283 RepID=UPI00397C5907
MARRGGPASRYRPAATARWPDRAGVAAPLPRRVRGHFRGRAGAELAGLLTEAGFEDLRTELLDLDPPVACVLGVRPNRA